jgi:hypothetical protein
MSRIAIPYFRVGIMFNSDAGIKRRTYCFLSQAECDLFVSMCKPYGGVPYQISENLILDPAAALGELRHRGFLQPRVDLKGEGVQS